MNSNIPIGNDKNGKVSIDLSTRHFILLVGQTNSGKSIFHNNMYKRLVEQNTPKEIGFIFLDMTQVDSWESSYTIVKETNHKKAITILEKLACEPINPIRHTIVHIEECDMFQNFTERAEEAIRNVLKNRADVTIVYSTSRPSPRAPLRQSLLDMVDTKVIFELNSKRDLQYILKDDQYMPKSYEKILAYGSKKILLKAFSEAEAKGLQGFIMK